MYKKNVLMCLLSIISTVSARAAESQSIVVCGRMSAIVSTEQGQQNIWQKVDLDLNTEEHTLSYRRYIGIIGQPEKKIFREMSLIEQFTWNNSESSDSGVFTDLKELTPSDELKALLDINPQDVATVYQGETFWARQRGYLVKLKNGTYVFSTGMIYSSNGEHCQMFNK